MARGVEQTHTDNVRLASMYSSDNRRRVEPAEMMSSRSRQTRLHRLIAYCRIESYGVHFLLSFTDIRYYLNRHSNMQ